jgi:hypothetical protein
MFLEGEKCIFEINCFYFCKLVDDYCFAFLPGGGSWYWTLVFDEVEKG